MRHAPANTRESLPEIPGRSYVLGASSGIGAALARYLLRRGSTVTAAARRTERIQALLAEEPGNGRATFFDLAASPPESLLPAGELVDLFLDSAGLIREDRHLENPELLAQFRRVNLDAPVALMRLVGDRHLAPGGVIVNISSAAATKYREDVAAGISPPGFPGELHYGETKARLSAATADYDAVLRDRALGQRAFSLEPGLMDTEEARAQFAHVTSIDWAAVPSPEEALIPVLEQIIAEKESLPSMIEVATYRF